MLGRTTVKIYRRKMPSGNCLLTAIALSKPTSVKSKAEELE